MAKNRAKLVGNNTTGVGGAQLGRQKNAQGTQGLAGAGATNYEFGTELGAAGARGAGLAGNNITGVGGAQNARNNNAQALARAARKAGQ